MGCTADVGAVAPVTGAASGGIAPLPAAEAAVAARAAGLPVGIDEMNLLRVLVRHPRVARSLTDLLVLMITDGTLDPRLRELVIMRVGWVTGSEYEWTQHWVVARRLGISGDDLLATRNWTAYEGFGPVERAVLAATDETLAGGRISATTWAEVVTHLATDEERIELVTVIGLWNMVSSILRTLEVPLEDGVDPWPPDGSAP